MIVFFLAADHVVHSMRLRKVGTAVRDRVNAIAGTQTGIPSGAELALNHTWVRHESEDVAVVGLDEFVAKFFGSVERIVVPDAGRYADGILMEDHGRSFFLTSPVGGRVVEVNTEIMNHPASAAGDPYGAGWLFKLSINQHSTFRPLVSAQANDWLNAQAAMAREFFLGQSVARGYALMQDGGVPIDGVLKAFDQGVWQEFGLQFLTAPGSGNQAAAGRH
jgi:glycine cleavage system H protein